MVLAEDGQALMTKLQTLRTQLASLKGARASLRWGTALAALATAILWLLAAYLALDLLFERSLEIPQRMFLLAVVGVSALYMAGRFLGPVLKVHETVEDMALMVERQQKIDSDLVAALQFESPVSKTWGSEQLKGAVIDYVADVGKGINVFEGFSRHTLVRTAQGLIFTVALAVTASVMYPGHLKAFLNRLMLGGMHYPTRTTIAEVRVNRREVLSAERHGSHPTNSKCAEGYPLQFLVQTAGQIPTTATVSMLGLANGQSKSLLELKQLSLEQRLARLQQAQQKLQAATTNPETDLSKPWKEELLTLVGCDVPQVVNDLLNANEPSALNAISEKVAKSVADWPSSASSASLYEGELPRLLDGVRYKLLVGDAWTDTAKIEMIPLPLVELKVEQVVPEYARQSKSAGDPTGRQISVLEGTQVDLSLESTNRKPLQEAWMTLRTKDAIQKVPLQAADDSKLRWKVPGEIAGSASPFLRVTQELRYELQVLDEDGLSLESPVRGMIRIRPDRVPTASADIVHKVVLATAKPVVEFRATDDFGISKIALRVEVERAADVEAKAAAAESQADSGNSTESAVSPSESTTPGQEVKGESSLVQLLPAGKPLLGAQLPYQGKYTLALDALSGEGSKALPPLQKGDRLKLTLEVTDYRGKDPGQTYKSDSLLLEISDESGVLAAISEADERSEQRLSDLIKRQLGIGDTP